MNKCNKNVGRTTDEVKIKWFHMSSDIKKRESMRKRELNKTGGGPPKIIQLSDVQETVVSIIGETAISGIEVLEKNTLKRI